jgi:hypothetical protein
MKETTWLNMASVVTVCFGGCDGRGSVCLLTWSDEVETETRAGAEVEVMKAANAEAGAEVEVLKLQKPEQRARWFEEVNCVLCVKKRESRRRLQARRKTLYIPSPARHHLSA